VDAEGLKELFEPLGPVTVKRMFSGHGVYAGGLCFALSLRGEVYLRTDSESASALAAAGSEPFVYQRGKKAITTSLWRLVASAYDDSDELKRWSGLALAAARKIDAAKVEKARAKANRGSMPALRKPRNSKSSKR
jgi:DNA transformation protein and related proteins